MLKFIVKRLLLGVVVMLGVITITFLLVHVLPSNPAAKWVGARATPEQIAQAEIELGLDKPLPVQYVNYIKDLLNLDMGRSLRTHQPVTKELANYLPATLELVLCATILAVLIGLPRIKTSWETISADLFQLVPCPCRLSGWAFSCS